MTSRRPVLTFAPHGFDAEVARLGERVVAYIKPNAGRGVCWGVTLVDWPRLCGPAASAAQARERIADQVAEWAASAGLVDPGAGVEIRLHERLKDEERASA